MRRFFGDLISPADLSSECPDLLIFPVLISLALCRLTVPGYGLSLVSGLCVDL